MSIVTLDEAKDRLNIDLDDPTDDDELQNFIDGIAVPVENHLHEIVARRTFTEDLELCGRAKFWLTNRPVTGASGPALTSLAALDGTVSYDVTKLKVSAVGLVRVVSGPRPTGVVTATYDAGYADEDVPRNIKEGALVILQHVWGTQRGPGKSGGGVIGPEEIRRALATFTIPNKAIEWLGQPTTMVG